MGARSRQTVTRWISCDVCGTDAGDELRDPPPYRQALREGFEEQPDGRWLCASCLDPLAPVNVPTTTENRASGR